ncbi:MAG: hypothetical protein IKX78_05095, partial [Clostridia bacterium]|nr:hypothetical protein [Clostridia bacterium]
MRNRALKYATAALIIVMVLSLCSSCVFKLLKDPYDIYKYIYNYTRNVKNYAADIVIDINYNETVSKKKRSCYLGITGTLKVTGVGSEDMMMESHQKNVINSFGY